MDTRELHVLEVVGEFILRLRGNRSFPIKYTALRTRAQRLEDGTVMFGEPLSGHDHCRVEPWFRDWSEADNSQRLLQDGRPVDVLVLSQDLSRALSWRGVGHPPRPALSRPFWSMDNGCWSPRGTVSPWRLWVYGKRCRSTQHPLHSTPGVSESH